jgi:hypothetical protein
MALYDRLLGFATPKISVHAFMAALAEFERGKVTQPQISTMFGLDAGEQTELATLAVKIIGLPEAYPMGGFATLTNVGAAFDTILAAKGLGFVAVDVTGITQATLRIRYNKIGTGTLSWQLFNETDAVQLAIGTDAAAAGDNKTIDLVATPGSPLTGGVKLLRPRVMSSVATDDPVYYGSCLFVRRAARLASEDLHEVLLLGELKAVPYDTVALVKTRLGV